MNPTISLWNPDRFSVPRIEWHPIPRGEAEIVQAAWEAAKGPSKKSCQILKCALDSPNSSNYKVSESGQITLLKVLPDSPSLRGHVGALLTLQKTCPTFGSVFPHFNIVDFARQDLSRPDRVWVAMQYVDGRHFSGRVDEVDNFKSLLRNLESTETEVKGQSNDVLNNIPIQSHDFVDSWTAKNKNPIQEFLDSNLPTGEEADHLESVSLIVSAVISAFPSSDVFLQQSGARSVTHIDIHPHNIIVDAAGSMRLLDVLSFQRGVDDIFKAYGIYKLLRQRVVHNGSTAAAIRQCKSEALSLGLTAKNTATSPANLAALEALRRLDLVLNELNATGESRWRSMIPLMCRSLHEIQIILDLDGLLD